MNLPVYYLDYFTSEPKRAWNSGCSTELDESKCFDGNIVSLHVGYGVMRDHLVAYHPKTGELAVFDM